MIEIFIYDNKFDVMENGIRVEKLGKLDNLFNKNIDEEIRKFIISFENQKIDGLNINQMYRYEEVELYNFSRGTIYNNIKDIITKFCLIENISKSYNEEVLINTNDEVYEYISKYIFNFQCKLSTDKPLNQGKKKDKKILEKINRVFMGFKYLLTFKLKNINNKKENILAITHASDINSIIINNKTIFYDSQFGRVLDWLKNEKNLFKIQYLNNDLLIEKSNKLGNRYFPFENFLIMKKLFYKFKIDNDKLYNKLELIDKINFNFHDFNLLPLLKQFVFCNIKEVMDSYLIEKYSAEKFIKYLNIDKIVVTDEADRARCFIYSGNKLDIETFAIQHGIITKASCSYFIPSHSKKYIPNKTFVWGDRYKKTLIEDTNIYDSENVIVVGQPRTDYLYDKLKDKKEELKSNKVRIFYGTQYIKELAYEATDLLFNALNEVDFEYELLVKLHPSDVYLEMYDDLLKKYNLKNVKITKEIDIYDGILWSDIVISVHSTINLEAAILNKPSLCILLEKYWDQGDFVKNNVSLGAKDKAEIMHILSNIKEYSNKNSKDFINSNFYKVDGLVSKRIINNIT